MERSTIFHGKIHYKWPFSIAMLNYQRVCRLMENNQFCEGLNRFWGDYLFSDYNGNLCGEYDLCIADSKKMGDSKLSSSFLVI